MKSEPEVFSFDDLMAAKGRRTFWDGVRNYQARNLMRDELMPGDRVLFYHSNADPTGVAGVCAVVGAAAPDPTQFEPADPHHDPRSDPDAPTWVGVTVKALAPLPRFVTLAQLKAEPRLAGMACLQRGNRLSVQPVKAAEWRVVLALGGLAGRF
jgi:predicted RNA-binding protein with PUA-like domain